MEYTKEVEKVDDIPDNTVENEVQRVNGRFAPGVSGNPSGRPKGSKNKTTIIRQDMELQIAEILEKEAETLVKKAIELANNGETSMLKLLMDKMYSNRSNRDDDTDAKPTGGVTITINTAKGNENIVDAEIIRDED